MISDGVGMLGVSVGGEMCLLTSMICPQVRKNDPNKNIECLSILGYI